jgi:hypothetical protein
VDDAAIYEDRAAELVEHARWAIGDKVSPQPFFLGVVTDDVSLVLDTSSSIVFASFQNHIIHTISVSWSPICSSHNQAQSSALGCLPQVIVSHQDCAA